MSDPHRIVIVGGGAAGLELATALGNRYGKKSEVEVTLIDPSKVHIWKPLLHQVAAGTFDIAENSLEYLAQAYHHNFRFRLGYMEDLERENKQVWVSPTLSDEGEELIPRRTFPYDTLVISVGSMSNDFGVPGVQEHCFMLDTTEQAEKFQKRLLEKLIRASAQETPLDPGQLDVAIVGAGATGVELAAQLHQVTRVLTEYGLDQINPDKDIRIHIVEGSERILPALPPTLSASVSSELERIGVQVHTGEQVVGITEEGVQTKSGKLIPASVPVWAAGIKAPDFLKEIDGLETNRINQLLVNKDLRTTRDPNIFAMGDCSQCPADEKGNIVPPRAQAAHQQASFIAKAIKKRLKGKTDLGLWKYQDYGALVTLGRYSTVGNLMGAVTGRVFITGLFARTMYMSLHKMHQVALHGLVRTGLFTLSKFLRRTVDPQIKLH